MLVDLKPTGPHDTEDLHLAGGAPAARRGFRRLWHDHVLQAEDGCGLDILRGA